MAQTHAESRPGFQADGDSTMDWLRQHARPLVIGAAVVAVAVAGIGFYRSFEGKKADRAEQALRQARGTYESGNLALAQTDLKKLVDRYSGTAAGAQGALLLAQTYYDAGKPAEGLKALEGVRGGELEAAVLAARAAGLQLQKKGTEAAQAYLEAAGKARTAPERLNYRADAARAYAAAGQTAQAAEIWRELEASGDPSLSAEARLRLGELTAKPITAAR